jgi:hypothetical protein
MSLPTGVTDPLFTHELALELGMSVQEMTTGVPGMTAHELTVAWPLFFEYRQRSAKREAEKKRRV